MSDALTAAVGLNNHFAVTQPGLFARRIEAFAPEEAVDVLQSLPDATLIDVWERLSPDLAREFLAVLPEKLTATVLSQLAPTALVNLFSDMEPEVRATYLQFVSKNVRQEIDTVLVYPEGSAGRKMDSRILTMRPTDWVEDALTRLRQHHNTRVIYTVDDDLHLLGRLTLEAVALAAPETILESLAAPVEVVVNAVDPMEDVVELFETLNIEDVPVIDINGRLVGHFEQRNMAAAIHSDSTSDLQAMVGVSRDERALSSPLFAVRKRIGWLQINLLTAFMAASVVGLFEGTIAKYTALAVLLPVVAGQSGNAGAQALAVTMRGLALREITLRHWFRVTWKEAHVGLVNGIGIAITCGIGVYIWSGSLGMVLVISLSMVLAMVAAGLAGAMVPIVLTRFGQDPATASSIILTTVTDIAGFFSFLGIATLLSDLL
ncbi:magnesium transporter [Magnetovibrio blakemorei]|uniref:CBS domain-containing protein n=1 Tax=Magnetovibrio blakemorei TaxID=28181 RepID=A0A1E5Q3B3_9PROT|nr:magnesium transporter [Magnetovibrio blakemorei]OEJ63810.1 hypothetical protein BEN30_17390 [Magnetovibrio blakemorei]